eukprot:s593_g11.t1
MAKSIRIGTAEELVVHWQDQWASEQARQELCRSSFETALSHAEVSLHRKAAAFIKSLGCQGPLARSQDAWLIFRGFEAWLVYLANEKAAQHFAQREEQLREEEEQHQADLKTLEESQAAISSWIHRAQQGFSASQQHQRAAALRCGAWRSAARRRAEAAAALRNWLLAIQRAKNVVQQEQLVLWRSRSRLLLCLCAWHSFATSSCRERQRLDLEEKEAALPKRQRKDLKSRLWRYMDWLTICDSKKAQRISLHLLLHCWHLAASVSRRCRRTAQHGPSCFEAALLARAWAAWWDAHVQAQVAAICAQEHSQALEAKAAQDARASEIAGRCIARQFDWLMITILRRWGWSATTGRGLQRASDQLEQEGRLCATAAQAVQQELNQQKDALALARQLRSRERMQLEKQLTESQEALSRANAQLAKENEGASQMEAEIQRVDALLSLQGDDLRQALQGLVIPTPPQEDGSENTRPEAVVATPERPTSSSYSEGPSPAVVQAAQFEDLREARAQAKVERSEAELALRERLDPRSRANAAWSVRLRPLDSDGVRRAASDGQNGR